MRKVWDSLVKSTHSMLNLHTMRHLGPPIILFAVLRNIDLHDQTRQLRKHDMLTQALQIQSDEYYGDGDGLLFADIISTLSANRSPPI